jgi:hypothetical protein
MRWSWGHPAGCSLRASRTLVGRVEPAPHSSAANRANLSAARPGLRAFRGINGRLPTCAAAGPFHLFHGAHAPVLHRGALGVARRPTNAGQNTAQQPNPRRGIKSRNPAPSEIGAEGLKAVLKPLLKRTQCLRTAGEETVKRRAPGRHDGTRHIDMKQHKAGMRSAPDWRAAALPRLRTVSSLFKAGVMPWPGAVP